MSQNNSPTGATGTNVCDTQDSFNQGFQNAVDYVSKQNMPALWIRLLLLAIMLILIVLAVTFASRVTEPSAQKLHILLAIMFAPFYIISYYLSEVRMN
jgi:hypothetical protein